jgi:hypothetical protein
LGFGSSSEDGQAPSRCDWDSGLPKFPTCPHTRNANSQLLPCGSDPFSAFPARSSRMNWLALPRPTACAFRCSQPLGAFIRPALAGLVSCRIRSWGRPPELCSFRAAVCCLQHPSPHDVSNVFRVLLHSKVRHPIQRFRPKSRAWLSWAFCPPGYSLSALAWPSPARPSCG